MTPGTKRKTLRRPGTTLDWSALAQACYSATFGHRLTAKEAKALLDAYMNAEYRRGAALIDAERALRDASAQRALVELLTNELDKRQQGDG